MIYPRILIFGQTFNDFSGGGITLSSLFRDWPAENLAVMSYPYMLHNCSTNICRNYYQIGVEELKWKFPLSVIKKKFPSGKLVLKNETRIPVLSQGNSIRHNFSSGLLNPFLKWSGLVHSVSTLNLSPRIRNWLTDFSPEILYMQISNRESILFAQDLIEYLKVPSVIHMMDDWPSTISSGGIFSTYWRRRIDHDFRALLGKTDLHLSISDAMTEEYSKRYGKLFTAFHNPIEPERFDVEIPAHGKMEDDFRILYIGRIGIANKESLCQFGRFISTFTSGDKRFRLDIYTKDIDSPEAIKIKKMNRVKVKAAIDHKMIPALLKSYELLLLPLDFTSHGLRFSKYSMPTKASEYMISGTPILVFAPSDTAISQFCRRHNCGYCVTSDDFSELEKSISLLSQDHDLRELLANNARRLAYQVFDGESVRKKFRELISALPAS